MSWPRGAPVPNALDESLLSRFRNDTERLIDRPAEVERFGIAVSGGPDSMALLALAHATYPGQVEAATVNHGFRTEAAEEAAMVAQWCGGKGIPHATLHPPEPIVGSLQSAARKMRYRLLWHWRSEEHTSELQSLMRISSAVFCLKKNKHNINL